MNINDLVSDQESLDLFLSWPDFLEGGPNALPFSLLPVNRDVGYTCAVSAWLWRICIPLAVQHPGASREPPRFCDGSAGYGLE